MHENQTLIKMLGNNDSKQIGHADTDWSEHFLGTANVTVGGIREARFAVQIASFPGLQS